MLHKSFNGSMFVTSSFLKHLFLNMTKIWNGTCNSDQIETCLRIDKLICIKYSNFILDIDLLNWARYIYVLQWRWLKLQKNNFDYRATKIRSKMIKLFLCSYFTNTYKLAYIYGLTPCGLLWGFKTLPNQRQTHNVTSNSLLLIFV